MLTSSLREKLFHLVLNSTAYEKKSVLTEQYKCLMIKRNLESKHTLGSIESKH